MKKIEEERNPDKIKELYMQKFPPIGKCICHEPKPVVGYYDDVKIIECRKCGKPI